MTEPAVPPRDAYTHGHHASVLRVHAWRTAENSAAYLLPHLRAGLDVLDLGSGPGPSRSTSRTGCAPAA